MALWIPGYHIHYQVVYHLYYDFFTFFCHSPRRIFPKYFILFQIVDTGLAMPIYVHTFFFIFALQLPIFMSIEAYSYFSSTFFIPFVYSLGYPA